jgi:putative redox protein
VVEGEALQVPAKSVDLRWDGEGLRFSGETDGQSLSISGKGDPPGLGPGPMELLLFAVGSCTAMDVISILRKMRQPVEDFRIEVRGERAQEHPKKYTSIEVVYRFKGELDEGRVARAIELSETKYCSVEATLRDALPITSRFVIER